MATASLILNLLVRNDSSNAGAMAGIRVGLEGIAIAALGIGAALGSVISTGADFDATMAKVGAATGASADGMAELRDLAYEMGSATSFSASEAGEAMLELARAGMTEAEIKAGALQAALTLASAGELALGDAAGYVVQGLATFQLGADKAANVAAALAGAAAASQASVTDLGFGLAAIGPVAHMSGLSIEETAGAISLLIKNGMSGSDAGTSLKTMLMNLIPTTDAAKAAMSDLGLKFTDAEGNFLSLAEISQQLQDKMGHLSEAERSVALETIFGADAIRAAGILMQAGAPVVDEYTAAASDLAAAQRMADVNTSGMKGALEALGGAVDTAKLALWEFIAVPAEEFTRDLTAGINSLVESFRNMDVGDGGLGGMSDSIERIKGLFREIGESIRDSWEGWIRPTFEDLIDLLDPLVFNAFQVVLGAVRMVAEVFEHVLGPAIRTVMDFLADIEPIVGAVVAGFAAFAAVGAMIGGAVTAFWALNSAIQAVKTAFMALTAASPLGLFVAIAAGLVYLYTQSETFRNIVNAVKDAVVAAFQWIWDKIKDFWNWLKDAWANVKDFFTGPFTDAVGVIRDKVNEIKGFFTGLWDGLTGGIDKVWDTIRTKIGELGRIIREALKSALLTVGNPIADFFSTLIDGAGGILRSIWDGLLFVFDSFINLLNGLIRLWNKLPIVPDIPMISLDPPFLAEGGNITASGWAVVGDAGPELLELPRGARVSPLDAGGGIGGSREVHVYVHVPGEGLMVDAFRQSVAVRGGDVQLVLGST